MNNFNTCMAILSGFDNSAVGRLKRTWAVRNNTLSFYSCMSNKIHRWSITKLLKHLLKFVN